jgi:GT2 family glycosyltransferase
VLFRVDYAPNCALMVKTWLLRDSGIRMWDELYICQDNTVFCHELRQAGFRMYVTPKIEVKCKLFPNHSEITSQESKYYATRNWLYWGIKRRNVAVLASALLLLAFNAASGNGLEVDALLAAIRMTRSQRSVLRKAPH